MNLFYHFPVLSDFDIYSGSKAKRILFCLVIGFLFLSLGYVVDIRVLQKKRHVLQQQKLKTASLLQIEKLKEHKVIREQQKTTVLQTQSLVKLKHFVVDFDIPNILENLAQDLAQAQVSLQLLEPQTTETDEDFIIYPIKLEVNGSYKNLLAFINAVFQQRYFATFAEITLLKQVGDNENDAVKMQTVLKVYKSKKPLPEVFNSNNSVRQELTFNLPDRDVFARSIVKNSKTNLFLWALKELHFLGLVEQNQIIYGIVSCPTGEMYRVIVGDKIGLNQGCVTAIDKNGITVLDKKQGVYLIH